MQLLLLGGFWWTSLDEAERQLLTPNLNAWVCAILATSEQPVTREYLADLLWPELNAGASANSLRQRLHRLKQTPLIAGLNVGPKLLKWTGDSDVAAFRRCCTSGDWLGALTLYGGPLLQGVPFAAHQPLEDWLEPQRTKLHGAYRHALWQRTRELQASGERQAVVALLHQATQLDPDASDVVAELARSYLILREPLKATQAIGQHQAHLERELGEGLPADLETLLAEARGALGTADAPTLWGLPTFLTSFVGRQIEQQTALARLTAGPAHRWLTIAGAGGVGKTRLATELARVYAEQTRHGVYFFSLAPLSEESQVVEAILQAFGEPLEGQLPPRTRLFRALERREVLLVLDNFEHLSGIADLLPALLSACPQVRLLITSRQRLHFQAEEVLRLGPLGGEQTNAPDTSSVQLFIDRASRADLSFDTAGSQSTISRIVERCEGLPLAIELAAAWIGEYSPEVVLSQMQQSWDFLQTSLRDISERHRSLRAVFEYSWQVLPLGLRAAYTYLAIFRSPFSAAAAAALGVSEPELHLLEQRSLINAASGGLFVWHENLRTYALEQLGDQLTGKLDLHLDYFLMLAEVAAPQLKGREQARILSELAAVYPDLRSALAYAVRAGQIGRGLRLSGALHWFWYVRGFLEEGLSWLDLFLDKAEHQSHLNDSAAYALALRCAGGLSKDRSLFEIAAQRFVGAMQLYRSLNDLTGQAHTAHMQGVLERDLGHYPAARQAFGEAISLREQEGDQQGLATTLNDLGILSAYEGDRAAARSFFERSLVLKREVGDIQGVAYALNNITNVIDDLDEILTLNAESLRLKLELGDVQGSAVSYVNYAHNFIELGRLDEAAAQYIQALRLFRQLGSFSAAAELLGSVAHVALEYHQFVAALEFADAALHMETVTGVKMLTSVRAGAVEVRRRALEHVTVRPLPEWAADPAHALEMALRFLEENLTTKSTGLGQLYGLARTSA
ncbi:NACHT domain-containing protein [Deinococcus psychrotolerans]|uniref:NACHT domain-containing protein n=1 Tax=Deinococcus psychrotolerans TaxID=2489213 RepID=A0A3G8YNA3_9DEIO|nr:NB-ARC domain-containing protein [Deinococcus psychrotolerans]AZI44094.1 NACHT domain-containing protein [Deinococcus psychrotolerans]